MLAYVLSRIIFQILLNDIHVKPGEVKKTSLQKQNLNTFFKKRF